MLSRSRPIVLAQLSERRDDGLLARIEELEEQANGLAPDLRVVVQEKARRVESLGNVLELAEHEIRARQADILWQGETNTFKMGSRMV